MIRVFRFLRQFLGRANQQRLLEILAQFAKNFWKTVQGILGSILGVLRIILAPVQDFLRHLTGRTLQEAFSRASQERLAGLAAEMAYNAMLALFPGLLAVLAAIGLFTALQSTLYQIASLLSEVVPDAVGSMIHGLIGEIRQTRNQEVFSLGFIGSLWGFSGLMNAAMAALDQIHRVRRHQLRRFWQAKLVAIALAIGSVLLLISASALVLMSDFIIELVARHSCIIESVPNCPLEKLGNCLLEPPVQDCLLKSTLLTTWQRFQWPLTLGIVSTAFAFIYRFGPSHRQKYAPILPGAIIAAMMWALISNGFRIYVYHFSNYNLAYGTIGTFIILLLWLYLSSLAMLFGEQLNVTVGAAIQREYRRRQWQDKPN